MEENPEYISPVPKRTYSTRLEEQLEELKDDALLARFAASREKLAEDRYRPVYHYVNPEGTLNDPNGLCYWRGNYHLFYQAYPPEDTRQHWGHAVSEDLVHWRDLPLAIYPGIERCCFSGSALVEEDRVIAFYHGTQAGNMAAVSSDPLLLNWEKIPGNPVIPNVDTNAKGEPYRVYDPCIWHETEGYYSLSGTYWQGAIFEDCRMVQHLFFSQDLRRWSYLGPFIEGDAFTMPGEDGAVPYFWPLGDRHILLFASHQRGSQYLIGDYDKVHHRFKVDRHGRFNFGSIDPGGVHAPSAMPDGAGGVNVIYNINGAKPTPGWDHLMSLVRRLTLRPDGELGIEPVALETLRGVGTHLEATVLPANEEVVLEGVSGNAVELVVEIDPQGARDVCVKVLRSPNAEEYTAITYYRNGGMNWNRQGERHMQDALVMDISHASLAADVAARPPEVAPFELAAGEKLYLRIFIDRSVVEVFANGRQCLAQRVYPERQDSVGVSVRAQGEDAMLCSLDAWQMNSIALLNVLK
jgi:beta-fructofuranosidase